MKVQLLRGQFEPQKYSIIQPVHEKLEDAKIKGGSNKVCGTIPANRGYS